jgi:hypothetical protein
MLMPGVTARAGENVEICVLLKLVIMSTWTKPRGGSGRPAEVGAHRSIRKNVVPSGTLRNDVRQVSIEVLPAELRA